MVNSKYYLDLKIYLRFESIHQLLLYTSIPGKVAKHYENFLKPRMVELGIRPFPSKNREFNSKELKNLSDELQTTIALIVSVMQNETRMNVLTALAVLKDECESLQNLLSS